MVPKIPVYSKDRISSNQNTRISSPK